MNNSKMGLIAPLLSTLCLLANAYPKLTSSAASSTKQHSNAIDRQGLTRRRKLNLARALAVLCVVTVSCWGSSAAIGPTEPFSAPPLVVFIGDGISAIWGAGQEGPEFAEHSNWIDKGVSGQKSDQMLAPFQTDVIDLHPQIVHILVGTNDVYPGWTLLPSEVNAIDSPANVDAMVQFPKRRLYPDCSPTGP
jgi:hypothetical protein